MKETYVIDAIRTPFGRFGGFLAGVRPDDLAANLIRSLVTRSIELDWSLIDDCILGDANGAGEDNRNVARMAVLLSGLPPSIPGATVNRLCGSGLEAVISANRAIAVGDASLVIAGGVESMSRAPWVLLKPERAFPSASETLHSSTLGWRMVNPKMSPIWTVSLGEATEQLAERLHIDREAQDHFALASHLKAAQAWRLGEFEDEVIFEELADSQFDESLRFDASEESLAKLTPAFRPNGTITAGNASPLNDGAAMLLLGDSAGIANSGRSPLARIVSRGVSAIEPHEFGIGPVQAAELALIRAGITWDDVSLVELNEAFAAQSLACLRRWPGLDPSKVNIHGGAIAIGHPLGCSGARIVGHLAHSLHKRGGGFGLAAICIGVGQGLAMVLEGL